MTIRVGVFGAGGRMGATVCAAVHDDPELELAAVCDPKHAGRDASTVTGVDVPGLVVTSDATPFLDAGVQVVVDFTHIDAARANLDWCSANAVHAVVGTSGFTEADHAAIADQFAGSGANVVIAPNFAIGAVLMIRLGELAARWFDTAEIIELHHDAKVDAPSGTAVHTAERLAAAKGEWPPDPTQRETIAGARGSEGPAGIRVHAVRMRGMVAHQEILLGTTGQTLTLRHDSYDRTSFMPGVLLAVKKVAERPGLTVGLDELLEL